MRSNRSSLSLVVLILVLLISAGWRVCIALGLLFRPTLENNLGALINWRLLDALAGPTCILLLAATARRWAGPAAGLLGGGIGLLLAGHLAMEYAGGPGLATGLTRGGAALAVAGALLVVGRELKEVSDRLNTGAGPGQKPGAVGFDLVDLWRLVTVQWVLVWSAAEIALRFRMAAVDLASNPHARTLLFALPALGIMPNVLLLGTLRWWKQTGPMGSGRGKPRAWLLAMALLNAGAIMMVVFPRASGAGAPLMAAGIGLFLLGLPGLRKGLAGALAWLALGLMAWAALTLYTVLTGTLVHLSIETAVRYMLFPGSLLLWLLATGWGALGTSLPERYRAMPLARVAAITLPVGVVGTVMVLLLFLMGDIQLLSASTLVELFALLLAGPLAVRSLRLVK